MKREDLMVCKAAGVEIVSATPNSHYKPYKISAQQCPLKGNGIGQLLTDDDYEVRMRDSGR